MNSDLIKILVITFVLAKNLRFHYLIQYQHLNYLNYTFMQQHSS